MEFGIFLQGHLPGPAAFDRAEEHAMFLREVEYAICADRNSWKYVWVSEHHALAEYSHTSASEVFMAYCAARTSRVLVELYHDTFPHREGAPTWQEPPRALPPELLDPLIDGGMMLCGNPDEVVAQLKVCERTGVDQVCFGVPMNLASDDALELIETFGTQVIPEFDQDPVHSTTHHRDKAVPKFPAFAAPPPDITTAYSS